MLIQILAKRSEPINSSLPSNELINKIERQSWNNVYGIYERYPLFYRWHFSPRKVGQTEGPRVKRLSESGVVERRGRVKYRPRPVSWPEGQDGNRKDTPVMFRKLITTKKRRKTETTIARNSLNPWAESSSPMYAMIKVDLRLPSFVFVASWLSKSVVKI